MPAVEPRVPLARVFVRDLGLVERLVRRVPQSSRRRETLQDGGVVDRAVPDELHGRPRNVAQVGVENTLVVGPSDFAVAVLDRLESGEREKADESESLDLRVGGNSRWGRNVA